MSEPNTSQSLLDANQFGDALCQLVTQDYGVEAELEAPVCHLLRRPGKAYRPKLTFAIAEAYGRSSADEGIFAVAAAAELIHVATLMHDDIIDGATMRRAVTAVHVEFDPTVAVLAGDVLLGAALSLVGERASVGTIRSMGPSFFDLAYAQALETNNRNVVVDPERARKIAQGKTGALFGWIAQAAAYECGADDVAPVWKDWGIALGLLFQIADDLGDRLAINEGKDVGLDAECETPSLVDTLLEMDPVGDLLAREIDVLIDTLQAPPRNSESLAMVIEALTQRSYERLALLRKRLVAATAA